MITSESLAESNDNLIGFIASSVEKLRDDVTSIRAEMVTKSAFEAAITDVRGDIEQVHLRLNTMEHSVSSGFEQVETELSRLRSAVYVLGKDRPDILRLLGHNGS